jgi:hypothetical protein
VVWDSQKNTFDHPPTLRRPNGQPVDYFCCGHCFLKDGRVLVIGGTDKYDKAIVNGQEVGAGHGFTGIKDAMIFDPATEQWGPIKPMSRGRWYPTGVMLSSGEVIALSGLDVDGITGSLQNGTIELNTNPDNVAWTRTRDFNLPLYPHLFLLNDGRLFFTGGKMDTQGDSDPLIFDPINPTAAVLIGGLTDRGRCNQCASVILPPAQDQRYMILGGGPEDVDGQPRPPATQRVEVVDLKAAAPIYQARANLNHERMHVNAVLLPDQATDTWTLTAKATVARLYHSVALLLPDGRVVAAGGNPDKGSQVNWLPPDPMEEMRLEIYSPPYLFAFDEANPRPTIQQAPGMIHHGDAITIQTPQAQQISSISLIRPGLTTHSFNGEQRLVDVPFLFNPPDKLTANVMGDQNVAPPGWYMLFLTDQRGVPSIATWVELI